MLSKSTPIFATRFVSGWPDYSQVIPLSIFGRNFLSDSRDVALLRLSCALLEYGFKFSELFFKFFKFFKLKT
jgi:hypothetical protein